MATNGRRADGWKTWKTAWDALRRQVEAELRREKLRTAPRGRQRHPRRVARLKAVVSVLYALRAAVRAHGRLAALDAAATAAEVERQKEEVRS